jgi:1-acyl-sn-glycerol-3-phosphate acyltransferase
LPSTATAEDGQDALSPLRLAARAGSAVVLLIIYAPLHIGTKALFGRSAWPQRFLASVTWVLGVRPRCHGAPVKSETLLLPNHVSWIDIIVLSGVTGCAFVSKDELGHPLVHWLADQNETVYVKRTHLKGAKDQAIALAKALEGDKPVVVFPEGTVGPGTFLLPFRSTLIEAANYAAREVEVRPVALDYGPAAPHIAWYQQPALANARRVLGRRGTLKVDVHLLSPLDRAGDRKQMTREARAAIAGALGFADEAASPIGAAE